ncbi:hypothetical protein OS493_002836 [Desmophyllum pertusum]|uniref:Uncharacterized protein n=1 Tax=Desmophyllum pertusum TaxID=174260 RepID=A0A9W9YG99_9CNID|nr:hypothetical protein OS493_002836 [Desmophyllum pertusum]
MISIEIQNGPSSKSTPTFVPEMYEISANGFMASYSAFPKIQSTKQSAPPCVNCPCQFHYIGGEMLPLQLTSSRRACALPSVLAIRTSMATGVGRSITGQSSESCNWKSKEAVSKAVHGTAKKSTLV